MPLPLCWLCRTFLSRAEAAVPKVRRAAAAAAAAASGIAAVLMAEGGADLEVRVFDLEEI